MNKNIAIIGAGASGLLASIILSRAKYNVVVFEKNTKVGRKILATGNGKCNISNDNISVSNFYTNDQEFVKYVLKQFNINKFKQFFNNLGLELISNNDGKIFPQTLQSSSVVKLLEYEAKFNGVKFILNTSIKSISYINDNFMINNNQEKQYFDKIIVATGSKAYEKLGSSDLGYNFAKDFGHTIITPFASLVQLKSDNEKIKQLEGVKIHSKIQLEVNKNIIQSVVGDLLFTNYGLSGNAILDISREASYYINLKNNVKVCIDIFPDISKEKLISKLERRLNLSKNYNKDKYFWLEGFINHKLIKFLIDNCGIRKNINRANELNKKDIISLVYFIKNLKININGTNGFKTAEVSAGGIDISEIEAKTMQSKIQKNLYFTGEVLDVDGQCGGYNLHWAFSCGYVCANGIIN